MWQIRAQCKDELALRRGKPIGGAARRHCMLDQNIQRPVRAALKSLGQLADEIATDGISDKQPVGAIKRKRPELIDRWQASGRKTQPITTFAIQWKAIRANSRPASGLLPAVRP